ncbi:hypothetical protein LJY25_05095 [Hymenobacter sp. BT175]|uniref:hypothetical protein n=1 Tax=Hymenobacter translucens TaxID=2886507 RepID=UPI001D0DC7CF|nr:hypothetical protein [Hymenobacter translucens]MCC2545811.1 hypothetical protein [Hymenobacter translucens]
MPLARASRLTHRIFGRFYGQQRTYWRAIAACFLAASTFWLLNALNKVYTTPITYPLQWRYDATRYIPVAPLPREVAVNVTGRGWKLLRRSLLLDVRPAEVWLPRPLSTRFVTSPALQPGLQAAMEGLQLNYILTDTVPVRFDRLVTRRLPLGLSPAADGSALPYAARFVPATVAFRGPAGVVNALASPYPVHLPVAAPGSTNGSINVPIGGPDLVGTDVQAVNVRLRPRPLINVPMQVVPELRDFPPGREYRLQPATVRVNLQCFPEDTARLDRQQVRVVLHYGQFGSSDSSVRPVLARKPALARGGWLLTPTVRVLTGRQ